MSNVTVSVIIPFLNVEAYFHEALDSICCQTYQDIEILAVDDGSSDRSRAIVERFANEDSRFRLLTNKYSKGIVGALNTGLDGARGEFVARMDADDVALQNRLASQVRFLELHPEIGLCGSFVRTFGTTTPTTWALPTHHEDIKVTMLFHGAIAHPSVMLRRAEFERANLRYDQSFLFAEDLELWERASQIVRLSNLPRILMRYRVHEAGVTATRRSVQLSRTEQILRRAVSRLGVEPTEEEWRAHLEIANHNPISSEDQLATTRHWFDRLIAANNNALVYDPHALHNFLQSKLSTFRSMPITASQSNISLSARIRANVRRTRSFVKEAMPAKAQPIIGKIEENTYIWVRRAVAVGRAVNVRTKPLKKRLPKNRKLKIGMAVLAYERPDYLRKCLDSLFASDVSGFDIKFFLMDDGSLDPEVHQILEQPRPEEYEIERHFLPKGRGTAGAAINRALRLMIESGDFDILGWSDPDALYHPEWLKCMLRICLWARENHQAHVLGPFCCFNSSDEEYHEVLGRFASPYGDYVVKRQMGMLNYFMFKSDLEFLGFFDEGPDDETLMTKKLEKQGVRNFCTFNSYAEHLGQVSALARWRPSGLSRAVHGLHLAPGQWPESLKSAETIGYYSDVLGLAASPEKVSSASIDVVYVATDRDLETIELSIESVRRNLLHPIRDVFIIAPSETRISIIAETIGAHFVNEDDVLSVRKCDIRYMVDGVGREGWLFQQLLKFAAAEVVGSSRYLVMDADTVLVRSQAFVRDDKDLLLHSNEFHGPYIEAYSRLVNEPAKTLLSFVNHHMMFNVKRVRNLLAHCEAVNKTDWVTSILNAADLGCSSGFSEYLTYGLWCVAHYEDKTIREHGFNKGLPRSFLAPLDELIASHSESCRSISFHWYL